MAPAFGKSALAACKDTSLFQNLELQAFKAAHAAFFAALRA